MKYLINYIDLGITIGFVGKRAFQSFILTGNTYSSNVGSTAGGSAPYNPRSELQLLPEVKGLSRAGNF